MMPAERQIGFGKRSVSRSPGDIEDVLAQRADGS